MGLWHTRTWTSFDESVSLVGARGRKRPSIDRLIWGRAALQFARISVAEHEGLARRLGIGAAAEVLLLVIAKECGISTRKWKQARKFGIPWQQKRWTALVGYMEDYNEAVAEDVESMDEDAALSDSSENDLPADDVPPTRSSLEPKQTKLCAARSAPPAACPALRVPAGARRPDSE